MRVGFSRRSGAGPSYVLYEYGMRRGLQKVMT
jgi:hypothetical protein